MSLKEAIRNQIIDNERNELKGLKEMYLTYANAADLDEETTLSSDDYVHQDQSRDNAKNLEVRMNQIKIRLDNFLNLNHDAKQKVEPGALVLTKTLNFYIGVSASMFKYEGKTYIGLETNAPIYAALMNAKAGDQIQFNGQTYDIEEVL